MSELLIKRECFYNSLCCDCNALELNLNWSYQLKQVTGGGAQVAHRVERLPLRLSRDPSEPGSIPALGQSLHFLPSNSHSFLSISLYNKA